jgi:hypothetical protein
LAARIHFLDCETPTMKLVRVGAAILNQTPLDWDGNQRRIAGAIAAAREQGVSILCLPELCICGYGCEDAFHSPALRKTAWQVLQEIVPHTEGMIVSLGLPILFNNAQFNAACLVADGRILGDAEGPESVRDDLPLRDHAAVSVLRDVLPDLVVADQSPGVGRTDPAVPRGRSDP